MYIKLTMKTNLAISFLIPFSLKLKTVYMPRGVETTVTSGIIVEVQTGIDLWMSFVFQDF